MVKLVHGGDIYSAKERIQGTILDFSANINPLGLPDSVKSALMERLDDFALYPDPLCRELVQKIAESEQIAPEHILCANGAAELIFRLVQAIRPRCALVVAPTFAEYEQALNGCSCRVEYHLLKEEHAHFFEAVGNRIGTIHASDYDRKDERHWLPGEGVIDWPDFLRRLQASGYKGVFMHEVRAGVNATPENVVKAYKEVILGKMKK